MAGSGKTLVACQVALDMFFKREIEKPELILNEKKLRSLTLEYLNFRDIKAQDFLLQIESDYLVKKYWKYDDRTFCRCRSRTEKVRF